MVQHITGHSALRGLAALGVATGHYTAVFPYPFLAAPLNLHRTYLGVDLFFLLSGFILMHVYAAGFAGSGGGFWRAGWRGFIPCTWRR